MKQYVGIDIGKEGAIAIIDDVFITYDATPKIGTEIDLRGLSQIINKIGRDSIVVIEDVHAIFKSSAKSTFEFGRALGIVEGILSAKVIPFIKVAPKTWQKEMFQGVALMHRPSSTKKTMVTDTKSMALIAAQRLFPNLDFTPTKASKKPHNGIVDALLMAEYGRRKNA